MFDNHPHHHLKYLEAGARELANYKVDDNKILINDPVWGDHVIGDKPGDEVFLELQRQPLVKRSLAIEQLTLGPAESTIPGTTGFPRWEHMWGAVVLARQLAEEADISPEQAFKMELRAFVADLGHTAFSHLGDWMFQDTGTEDQHDKDLLQLLEAGGVNDVLRRHGYEPEELVFPDIEDWVERPSPDLCVDRVDYAAREIKRWLSLGDMALNMAMGPDSFTLRDGQLVITNKERALLFGKASLLLATEHWAEPVHRLQLKIQEALVKDVLMHDWSSLTAMSMDVIGDFHPRDLMYTTDMDIAWEMKTYDKLAIQYQPITESIGIDKRRVFCVERQRQLDEFLRADTDKYPNPIEHYAGHGLRVGAIPLIPAAVTIIPVEEIDEVPDFDQNPYIIDTLLQPLKPRSMDPVFIDESGNLQRLSEADTNFASLRQQQAALMKQAYVSRLHVNAETRQFIEQRTRENETNWRLALQRPRLAPEKVRQLLYNTVSLAAPMRLVKYELD